jgi:hypothetical protein
LVAIALGTNNSPGTAAVLVNTGGVNYLGVEPPAPGLAEVFQLSAPRPNPSRGISEIRFLLPSARSVEIDLFDLAGRRVRSLVSGAVLPPGQHAITWDGRDGSAARVGSGLYFLRVRAGRDFGIRKLVLER